MNDAHKIVEQVYAAKEDVRAADDLIRAYLPFIKAETAKFLKRPPIEGHDDELSIAMIAFHEAIGGYSRTRGCFPEICGHADPKPPDRLQPQGTAAQPRHLAGRAGEEKKTQTLGETAGG